MYKTIRHGENSLQYTILPQNDDFRIEGKLSSAGSSCSSRNSSRKSKAKRPKRRSFFAYLGLIFVCTVIVGAVLIPFLVSAECLPNPAEWFLKTKDAFTKGSGSPPNTSSNIEARTKAGKLVGDESNSDHGKSLLGGGGNIGKTVNIVNKNGVEKIILLLNKTTRGENDKHANVPPIEPDEKFNPLSHFVANASNSVHLNEQAKDKQADVISKVQEPIGKEALFPVQNHEYIKENLPEKPVLQNKHYVAEVRLDTPDQDGNGNLYGNGDAPTIVVTTLRNPTNYNYNSNNNRYNNNAPSTKAQGMPVIRPTSSFSVSNVNSPRAPPNPNQTLNSSVPAKPTIVTRIIQVPLLKSTAKKPIIPPVLAKTNSQFGAGAASVPVDVDREDTSVIASDENPKKADWMQSHWPYIDPSSYFQWTTYKAEDSVLLPALLGFALIGMIFIITVCLISRNKRTIVASVRKRNRNDVEENGAEDNATLLTTTNLSDED